MADAVNIVADLYARLWDVLLASAPVADAVKVGNRIRYDGPLRQPAKKQKRDADFPELLIADGERTDGMFGPRPTFAAFDPNFIAGTGAWEEPIEQEMSIVLTHRDVNIFPATQLEAEIEKALRRANLHLGLPYVVGFTVRARPQNTSRDTAAGVHRRVTTFTVRVRIEANGRDLV